MLSVYTAAIPCFVRFDSASGERPRADVSAAARDYQVPPIDSDCFQKTQQGRRCRRLAGRSGRGSPGGAGAGRGGASGGQGEDASTIRNALPRREMRLAGSSRLLKPEAQQYVRARPSTSAGRFAPTLLFTNSVPVFAYWRFQRRY